MKTSLVSFKLYDPSNRTAEELRRDMEAKLGQATSGFRVRGLKMQKLRQYKNWGK